MMHRSGTRFPASAAGHAGVRPGALPGLALGLTLLLSGCKKPAPPAAIPGAASPDAVRTVMEGLTENRPQVLWEALPPSYQADIRGLVATFCDHADADIYDRFFRILGKGVQVLQRKKEFIFNSPMTLDNVIIDSGIGLHWKEAVGVLDTLVNSELASIESLRRLDPGKFLASTGSRLMSDMEELADLAQRSPRGNPWVRAREALEKAQITFVPGDGNQGFLTFATTEEADGREVEMTQVEGRWIPAQMAADWKTKVAEARGRLAGLSSPEAQKAKPMVMMILNGLEGSMNSLLAARSQKEFDEILRGLKSIGDMAKALRPDAPPSGGPQ
ncbi:MAG: hypothetical protein H7A46_23190 [Verrucomicrobiales bacterium]|nr:hypothetical protein [Verrucomicrobiales bacterium]